MPAKLTESDLAQFTGTDQWYRHALMRNVVYTDGVKYMADHAGAHWLIDKVATLQMEPKVKAEEFQAWKLKVADSKAELRCEDGNYNVVYSEQIDFTDFPLDSMDLWVEMGDGHRVILLPSEH